MSTHYEVLGVKTDATDAELKSAYRKLSKQHHPDTKDGDAEKFRKVNDAYEILSCPEARKRYDEYGDNNSQDDVDRELLYHYNSIMQPYVLGQIAVHDWKQSIHNSLNNKLNQLVGEKQQLNFRLKRAENALDAVDSAQTSKNIFKHTMLEVIKQFKNALDVNEVTKNLVTQAIDRLETYTFKSNGEFTQMFRLTINGMVQ